MSQVQHYQELIQQAARLALERSVAESDEPSVDAIEPAAKAIREALSPKSETVKRDFEYAFHTLASDIIEQLAKTPESTAALSEIKALLDTAILLCSDSTLEPAFVFSLTDETMDSVSIEVAQELFGFLETRTTLVRKVMAETTGKGVAMLKICNSLLRRIPHATMGEFAGSVQIFIANSFPLSERSGVNVRGDFDTSNIPAIDTAGLDEGGREEKLYRSFWSLQECFANPQSVFKNRPESFDSFVKAAKLALEEFRKVEHKNQPQATATAAMHDTAPLKYLTSPRLLWLQFGDPQFKCQILVQLLIFTKYALSMAGENFERLKEAAVNKLVVVNMEITDAEEQTLRDLSERAGNQLLTMPRDRGTFRRAAVFMLMHEADWARWKAGSCKPFEGVPIPELVDEMQSAAQSFFEVRDVQYRGSGVPMGSAGLEEVWATDV
ncbi:hypothetical protein EC988_005260, partial [Linderina pennispora]